MSTTQDLVAALKGELRAAASPMPSWPRRSQRIGQDFAQAHLAEQRLPEDDRTPYTLLVGMRSWLFAAFRDLKRVPP